MELEVPPEMDKTTANQCFMMGLQMMLELHKDNVVVSYKTEKQIQQSSFGGDKSSMVKEFVKRLHKEREEKSTNEEIVSDAIDILEKE